ncbi:MAG: hypothetical protein NVS1B1_10110 [Candidatus Limnocylindrales bacterium]
MLRLAGRAVWMQGHEAEGSRQVERAIGVLEGAECAELARAKAQLAGVLMSGGEMAEAIALADEAIELAERTDDSWARCHGLVTKGSAMTSRKEGLTFIRQGLELALRTGNVEAATRAYNNGAIALLVAGSTDERWKFITEGIVFSKRQGFERHAISHLYNMKAFGEFDRGDWDAALEAAAAADDGSVVRFGVASLRANIAGWRDGPAVGLPVIEAESARGLPDTVNGKLFWRATVAAIYGWAGDTGRAREELRAVHDIAAAFPRGGGAETASPRSAMGGPASGNLIVAALLAEDASLLDDVEAEVREHGLTELTRAHVRAVRAALAGDGPLAAKELAQSADAADRLQLAATAAGLATLIASFEVVRTGGIGPAWQPLLERARAFATRVKAPYWLGELDRLTAAIQEAAPRA